VVVNVFERTKTQTVKLLATSIKKKRVGILGGTFNPPHLGHLIIADQVADQLDLDEVLFMPDATPPHVDKKLAIDAKDRAKMVAASIHNNPRFHLELSEIMRGGVSYTYDTMLELRRRHPENDYFFIIGGDMVAYLPKWHRIAELQKIVKFVGVRREGYEIKSDFPVIWVDVPLIDVSSTLIRKKIRNHHSIHYLVTPGVEQYIKEHQLYLD